MRYRWMGPWRRGDGDGRGSWSLGVVASWDGGRVGRRAGVDEGRMFKGEHVKGDLAWRHERPSEDS